MQDRERVTAVHGSQLGYSHSFGGNWEHKKSVPEASTLLDGTGSPRIGGGDIRKQCLCII